MLSPIDVSDIRSNAPEQIIHAVDLVKGKARQRRAIFEAIYRGKKKIKTVSELISVIPGSSVRKKRIRVLQEGGKLAANEIVHQIKDKKSGHTAYEKIPFYSKNYKKILDLALNPQKVKKISTKRTSIPNHYIKIYTDPSVKYQQITIDDIDSFKRVRGTLPSVKRSPLKLSEETIKSVFKKIIGETGDFKDWGGEQSDLYSTKLRLKNTRISTAIAFKGKATDGKLTPEKMGKRGTQIERLFQEPAQLFLIVYQGQIDPRVVSQMQAFALGKAMLRQKIYYGVIDADDLNRLFSEYNEFFDYKPSSKKKLGEVVKEKLK